MEDKDRVDRIAALRSVPEYRLSFGDFESSGFFEILRLVGLAGGEALRAGGLSQDLRPILRARRECSQGPKV
jgi:hypothetical protein